MKSEPRPIGEVALLLEQARRKKSQAEKTIRAAAALLDCASDEGNTEVSGTIVLGVVEALQLCAERLQEART
jgi:hypothetical protein